MEESCILTQWDDAKFLLTNYSPIRYLNFYTLTALCILLLITGMQECSSVIHWRFISSLVINGDKNELLILHIHQVKGCTFTSWAWHDFELTLALPSKCWTFSCTPNKPTIKNYSIALYLYFVVEISNQNLPHLLAIYFIMIHKVYKFLKLTRFFYYSLKISYIICWSYSPVPHILLCLPIHSNLSSHF